MKFNFRQGSCLLLPKPIYKMSLWIKRERRTIKSWIHLSIPIPSSRLVGAWSIETLQNHKTTGLSKLDKPIVLLLIRTDITFINQSLSIRVLLLRYRFCIFQQTGYFTLSFAPSIFLISNPSPPGK